MKVQIYMESDFATWYNSQYKDLDISELWLLPQEDL